MTDQDITKLASKLTKSLATKDDIKEVKNDIKGVKEEIKGVKEDVKKLEVRLDRKITTLDDKVDAILKFVENIDETTFDHEKRLKRIEAVPVIAHAIKI